MLKENAIEYFRSKASIYNERYSVKATGDLLWTRHYAILETVQNWRLPRGSRILDLGCGPGLLTRDLANMGYCGIGLDASPAMIAHSRELAESAGIADEWSYRIGDVEAVPLPNESFDAVTCAGVIDYLETDDRILAEAARLLKPNGRFLFCFTNKFGYTVSLSTPIYYLKRLPGAQSFASWLRSLLVGGKQGAMAFDFLPRKHRPAEARSAMAQHGFRILEDRFLHFSLLPAPLCTITSRLNMRIDEKLNELNSTRLRALGSCYILSGCLSDNVSDAAARPRFT
ncbi:MAG TPA: methyltransferase domain-containing protein [Bryobacteraceae bacterium]|jgi:ubiquinone/menaquinone biosynthesis C-methylase UbiE|nr:methyltransferase domain-containing protein [Bryobacteraceae bacterium]HXR77226.1 methyltransferase domain-containing protein [Bryobacteraceae bacterium]